MGTFVTAHSTLPGPKVDARSPTNPDPNKRNDASSYNALRDAANDLRDHVTGWVNVLEYGAVGDGITDDTTAIHAAVTAAADIGVRGGRVFFPPGVYYAQVAIDGTVNNSMGERGILLSGYGATLKGRAASGGRPADSSIIIVNGAIEGTDPTPGSTHYANGLAIEGFDLDMSLMPAAATTYGIAIQRSYDSSIRNVHVIGEPNAGGGLYLGNNVYTYTVEGLNCGRVKIHGYDNSGNMTSASTFIGLTANQVAMDNVFSLTFLGGAIQGSLDHFVMSNAQVITVLGMDLEGTGGFIYNFGANVRAVVSRGNSPGGYTSATYATGVAFASDLADRPVLGVGGVNAGAIGTYARVASGGTVNVSSTGATTIYTFADVSPAIAGQGLFLVAGDDGTRGWADQVFLVHGVAIAASQNSTYGAGQPTRTYSYSSGNLQLTLSAVAANHVRVTVLENVGN